MRVAALTLLAALATVALAGCAAKLPVAVSCTPPVVWLQDIPEPALGGKTNKDLAELVLGLREALRLSNLDKYHLREWLAERHGESPQESLP
jgi:hypothetical protein